MSESHEPKIQNFFNFFGGNPDEVMKSEILPCSEVKPHLDSLIASMAIMPLLEFVQSDWKEEKHLVEFQNRNRAVLDKWLDILKDRLTKLKEGDERMLYRYDIITEPSTFLLELRLAAIPTMRGVVIAMWTAFRYNDEEKQPLMISPTLSIMADKNEMSEADLEIIHQALTDNPKLEGDAGLALAHMVEILNRPRIVS